MDASILLLGAIVWALLAYILWDVLKPLFKDSGGYASRFRIEDDDR